MKEKGGRVFASCDRKYGERFERIGFTPSINEDLWVPDVASVKNGWLVAFNAWEFGGEVRWLSKHGRLHHKISNKPVMGFFSMNDDLYAIEGYAHWGFEESSGSILKFIRPSPWRRWTAETVLELPAKPILAFPKREAEFLILLRDSSVISFYNDRQIITLTDNVPWPGLGGNSGAFLEAVNRIYVEGYQ